MLAIGDEILSGRTRDLNIYHLATELKRVGIDLREARIVADETDAIATAVNELRRAYDHVFTSGGIGPTHDDITADAIAAAFGIGISVREEARVLIEEHITKRGYTLNDDQLRMARIPDGATLIDNTVSAAPGFTVENVHVMAGVPEIFQAMVAAVLPTLDAGVPLTTMDLRFAVGESRIASELRRIAEGHPALSIGSYPFHNEHGHGTNIVVRGIDPQEVEAAYSELQDLHAQTQ